jgi:predicted NBD/HSP70 family sugar kinase
MPDAQVTPLLSKAETGKEFNRRLVLKQIRQQAGISRSDIVRLTGLGKATISAIVGELIEAGLVIESGNQNPSVGRPKISLTFVANANFALGAELTDEGCRVVLVNLDAKPLRQSFRPVVVQNLAVSTLLQLLVECVAEVTAGIDVTRILALGVCVPGIVNPPKGVITYSVILPWKDVDLGAALRQHFPFPVAVFSRGSAATWGERWYGAGKEVSNLLYLRVGSGIVGGLVINGQPYLGSEFGAGELGHITVDPQGPLCRCGNRGCLATLATTNALLNRVRQLLREDTGNALWRDIQTLDTLELQAVIRAAETGNPIAAQGLAEVGQWLALAVASVVNLLNLEMVIIGGPLARAGNYLLAPLQRELAQRALPTHLSHLQVVASVLKEDAPAVGAASLVLHELMEPFQSALLPALSDNRISLFQETA